jgi:hypothetical protein
MNGAPADIAERRYERWVMRAVELAHGSYPADGVEAERMLLLRMQDSLSGSVSPTDPWREGGSTPEEAGGLFSGYGEDHVQDVRSLVFALYSAAGGDEWPLDIKLNNDASLLARVRGNSLESSRRQVDISVDVRSLACEDADDLRALHERSARELPRREVYRGGGRQRSTRGCGGDAGSAGEGSRDLQRSGHAERHAKRPHGAGQFMDGAGRHSCSGGGS